MEIKPGGLVIRSYIIKDWLELFIFWEYICLFPYLLEGIGIILFSHSSLDRALGYGIKYEIGFKYTHLGELGENNG